MFNFTTTTIINSNKVLGQESTPLFAATEGTLTVKSNHKVFKKANVEAVYKAAYQPAELAQKTVTMKNTAGAYRLKIYVSLVGSENSYYANDFVYKGKPFYIEFSVSDGEAATAVATKVEKVAKKYQLLTCDTELLKVKASGSTVTVTATDEYQRITDCVVEKFDPAQGKITGTGHLGMFVEDPTFTVVTNKEGKLSHGSYTQLMKDMQLPTAANTRWTAINQDEKLVPGAVYDQYTLYYCVNRGVMGGDAVGETVKSRTCHVFYVQSKEGGNTGTVSADFESALKTAFGSVTEAGKTVTADAAALPTVEDRLAALEKAASHTAGTSGQKVVLDK